MGSREQNFYNSLASGWATATRPRRSRSCTWPATTRAPRRPCPSSSSTAPRCSVRPERIAERMAEFAAAGVTTLSVTPSGADDRRSHHHAAGQPRDALEKSGARRDDADPGDRPRHRRGPDRVPPGLLDRPPAHRRRAARLALRQQRHGTTTNDPGAAFTAVIQLGAILAVVLYFWRELVPHRDGLVPRAVRDADAPRVARLPDGLVPRSSRRSRSACSAWSSATRSRRAPATCGWSRSR